MTRPVKGKVEVITRKNFKRVKQEFEDSALRVWRTSKMIVPRMNLDFRVHFQEVYASTPGNIFLFTPFWRGRTFTDGILMHEFLHWTIYPVDLFRGLHDIFAARKMLAEDLKFIPKIKETDLYGKVEDWKEFPYSVKEIAFCQNMLGDYCLHPETLITMANGKQKLITEIEKGDLVLGIKDGQIIRTKVLGVGGRTYSQEVVIELNSGFLVSSPEHRIFTQEGWKLAKDLNNLDSYYYLVNQNAKEPRVDKERIRILQKELQKVDGKTNSQETRSKTFGCPRSTLQKKMETFSKTIYEKKKTGINIQLDRNRKSLHCRDLRWGRNYNNNRKEIPSTHGNHFEYEYESKRILRKTRLQKSNQNKLGRNEVFQSLYSWPINYQELFENNLSLFSYKKTSRPFAHYLSSTQRKNASPWTGNSEDEKDLQTHQAFKLEKGQIRQVFTRKRDPLKFFDLKTVCGNFFANRILVHNCINLHIHDYHKNLWDELWNFLYYDGTFYEKQKALKRDTTFLLYLSVYPELLPGLQSVNLVDPQSKNDRDKIAEIITEVRNRKMSKVFAMKELVKIFHDYLEKDAQAQQQKGKGGKGEEPKCPLCGNKEFEIVGYEDPKTGAWVDV